MLRGHKHDVVEEHLVKLLKKFYFIFFSEKNF